MSQKSEAYIKTAFDNILSKYLRARRKPFGREPGLWKLFGDVSNRFQAHVRDRPTLQVKWGVGKGSWASVPWIAFLDSRETNSTQYGVYPVYLFREDLSGVCLALNQGIPRLRGKHGTQASRRILRDRAERLLHDRSSLKSLTAAGFCLDNKIDLHISGRLEKDYEASTITHKLYTRGDISNDAEMLKDLQELLLVYDQYLEQQSFREVETPPPTILTGPPHEDVEIASAVHEVIAYISDRGFIYQPYQIAQYITALRTKPFVILAGITGTGKSKLGALVAEATGGASETIPVRPNWNDSAEVLGYTNLEGKFQPSPVLRIAHAATANPSQFVTCIMDEMNLARVEEYFAEYLSKIEYRYPQEKGGFRTAPLLGQTLNEADAEWGEVGIPGNLAIVGTVNMDESTMDFSRKVIDRAFTIELSEIDLARWQRNGQRVSNRTARTWPMTWWHPLHIRPAELVNPTDEQLSDIKLAIDVVQAVNKLLPQRLKVAYRTRDEIVFYLLHGRQISDAFVDREGNAVDPLDLALQMKILPRIIGDTEAIGRCVSDLLGWAISGVRFESDDEVNSIIKRWEAAGRPSSLKKSNYPRLAARLCLMWQARQENRFTSYWL
jgi:hypothetical protein